MVLWIICPRCSHQWDWLGESEMAECGKCGYLWKVEDRYVKNKTSTEDTKKSRQNLIQMPEGMDINSFEGQKWLLFKIQELRIKGGLSPADRAMLNDLKDDIKTAFNLIEAREITRKMDDLKAKAG